MVFLLTGTANPSGEDSLYNGLRYTQQQLHELVNSGQVNGTAVKCEHAGGHIGQVVSSFIDPQGRLQFVMELDDSVEGALTAGFVKRGIASDLSLGYSCEVKASKDNTLTAGDKKLMEVSVVRKGAREGCHITAYAQDNELVILDQHKKSADSCWDCFTLD